MEDLPPGTLAAHSYLAEPSNWIYLPTCISRVNTFGSDGYNGAFRFSSALMPAIDRDTGYLFATAHQWGSTGSRTIITRSFDGGFTWSDPQIVDNQNQGHQIMPVVAAAGGNVSLLWYDSRNDSNFTNNELIHWLDA